MIECSRRGFHKCIDLLIENKASREKTSKVGDTALHVAALSNLSDTIYFLFSRKFDLCAVKEDKQTPLHLAVSQNRLEAVEALLFCGAPLDLKDKDKQTPLMIAAKSNYTALVDMIIRADRWNKAYPILSNDRKHLFNDNTGNHNNNNKNNDSTEDSESSRTYVGQHHDYHHHHLTTDNDANSIIPNDNDPNDVMMIEFIDPFKQLQLEENNEQINEIQLIVDHRSRTTASSESGSELSLGYEASRAWNRSDQRHYQSNHDQLNNSFSLSQISLNRDLTEPNFNQEHYDNDDDYHQRKHESLNNLSCQIQGDEIYLPNGETIFRITDTLLAQSSKNMRLLNGYGLNLTHPFTFRAPCQVTKFWGFTLDDITAIEYQDIGKNSYKEHTYRLLNIWLHGINDNQSPLNELYLALTTIGRKRIVEQLRRRIKTLNKLNNKHKCKLY
ncbi:unnamed protein product [Schistosoma margrebowiei]|uniref:Death domain-containing protein n=1 Tax=Schistosoma margrebowiei TaxID=48269 RepID=A0A3P7Z981_9TREM|nr:unnamed protein product [Schistosoma margrebowiei]